MNAAYPYLDILSADPGRTAVVEPGGRAISYGELRRRVVAFAAHLQGRGLKPGDRVLMQVPNGIEFATAAIAVLLTGGVLLLIEPGLGDRVYLSRVRAATPRWHLFHPLLTRVNRVPGLPSLLRRLELDVPPVPGPDEGGRRLRIDRSVLDRLVSKAPRDVSIDPVEREPGDDGILIFTGGTTSLPKGVRLSHDALGYYITHISSVLEGLNLERFLADTPQQVLYALRLGRTAYITRGRKKKRAEAVFNLVRRGVVDAYFGSPYVWTEMMARRRGSLARLPSSLKTVLLGGAPVTPEFLESLREWLHEDTRALVLYGMTEAGPLCAVSAEDKLAYGGDGDLVGRPLAGIRLEIDRPDPETGVGEVVAHSPSLYTGYLGQPDRALGDGLRTGDLGRIVDVGGANMLVLMGREKDMIIRNGVNIYPTSFEADLRAYRDRADHRAVRECAVIGVWNPGRQDEDVVCCVEAARGFELDLEHFRRYAETVCGTDAKPDYYLPVAPIPVTGRQNKVDKKALRRRAATALGLSQQDDPREAASARDPD